MRTDAYIALELTEAEASLICCGLAHLAVGSRQDPMVAMIVAKEKQTMLDIMHRIRQQMEAFPSTEDVQEWLEGQDD